MSTELKKAEMNGDYRVTPAADIYEAGDEYVLKLEMPGVSRENLEITLDRDELEITGKANAETPADKMERYCEYRLCDFYRRFRVGEDIDRNSIKAALDNGVLTLTLHKSEQAKPRKIDITVN